MLTPVPKQWIAKDISHYGSQSKHAKIAIHWFVNTKAVYLGLEDKVMHLVLKYRFELSLLQSDYVWVGESGHLIRVLSLQQSTYSSTYLGLPK